MLAPDKGEFIQRLPEAPERWLLLNRSAGRQPAWQMWGWRDRPGGALQSGSSRPGAKRSSWGGESSPGRGRASRAVKVAHGHELAQRIRFLSERGGPRRPCVRYMCTCVCVYMYVYACMCSSWDQDQFQPQGGLGDRCGRGRGSCLLGLLLRRCPWVAHPATRLSKPSDVLGQVSGAGRGLRPRDQHAHDYHAGGETEASTCV